MVLQFRGKHLRKAAQAVRGRLSQKSGNILVYIVMIMVIFAVLGVAMVSLFSTSIGSSATRNDTRRAGYLMESGIRYAMSELRAANFSKTAIANLNKNFKNDDYKINPTGTFGLNIFSPWFEPTTAIDIGTGGSGTEVVQLPEGQVPSGLLCAILAVQPDCLPLPLLPPLTIINHDYITTGGGTSPPGYARGTVTAREAVSGNPKQLQLEISDDGNTDGFVASKNENLCLAVKPSSDQINVSLPGSLQIEPAAAKIFPATGGAFEINRHNYYYTQAIDRTTHVELTGVTAFANETSPWKDTVNALTTDYVILSPRNWFIVSDGKSGAVAFGDNMDYAAGIADTSNVGPTGKPDIEFKEETKLSDVLSKIESGSGFAGVDDVGRRVTFTRTSGTPFASVWFKDTRNIGGQRNFCQNGRCIFGDGVRAFFIMTFSGPGDGFTFSLLSAEPNPDRGGVLNNTIASVGGDFQLGELLGYAGDGRTGTNPATYIADTDHGLQPPKMAVEFDGYYNNSPVGYCADANSLNASTRFDPEFSGSGRDNVQYVFWGNRISLAAPCRDNSPLYDDNRHNPQAGPTIQWTYPVGTQEITQRIKTGPDGTVYAVFGNNASNSDSRLIALDPFSGSRKWEFTPPPTSGDDDLDAIAVDNAGHIFLGSDDSKVFARKSDNTQLWSPFSAGGQVESPMAISESLNRIYFAANASANGIFVALNKVTGDTSGGNTGAYAKTETGRINSGVALDPIDGTIYFGTDTNPYLYALNTSTPFFRWRYSSTGNIHTQPVVNPSNRDIIFATTSGHVYALPYSGNSTTPTRRWMFDTFSSVENALAISPDGNTVYIGTTGGVLYALDAKTSTTNGSQRWRYPSSGNLGAIVGRPAVGGDGTVYFGSENGHVYALNPDTGALTDAQRLRWVFPSSGSIGSVKSAIEIGKDGNILFISDDGHLYSINPSTNPPNLRNLYLTGNELQPSVSGDSWFDQGLTKPWAVRVEVDRKQTPNANGKYEYTLRTWMRNCSDDTCSNIGTLFADTRLRYDYSPVVTLPMIQTIELAQSDQDLFNRFLFGFTSGSGSDQTITISRFQLSFIRPNDPVATADPLWLP